MTGVTAGFYATFIALITFVSNGTSTHLPEFIFGLPVAVGMLWNGADRYTPYGGAGRGAPHSLKLTLFTALAALFSHRTEQRHAGWCAAGFVFGFGAINGLVTIVKATLPWNCLVQSAMPAARGCLFRDQLMAAASPFAYAWLNKSLGITGGMCGFRRTDAGHCGFAGALVRSPTNKLYRTVSRALR